MVLATVWWWSIDEHHGVVLGIERVVHGGSHSNDTNEDQSEGSTLDSLLVLLNVGLGNLKLLDGGVNWGWLEHARHWSGSLSSLHEHGHVDRKSTRLNSSH